METKDIDINIAEVRYLHREVYAPEHPLRVAMTETTELHDFNISFAFDIEETSQNQWLFYGDVTIQLIPYGQMMTRTTCSLSVLRQHLVLPGLLKPMIQASLDKAVQSGWVQFKKDYNLDIPTDITVSHEMVESLCQHVQHAMAHRNAEDKLPDNHYLLHTPGLLLTRATNSMLMMQGTFMILDLVLYEDPAFNHQQNREVFREYVPLPVYETLKYNSLKIEKGNVQFNWKHTTLLFICMDCALQMLLGKHADTLQLGIMARGLTPQHQTFYVKATTELIRQLKQELAKNKARIKNLEQHYDWDDKLS